ncbi:EamA family transporter [Ornithinimicrobium cavernae]|uniref:EamA family transporter n=1 Tax=Ornithinimicrobium cavernae TaxID=2666047 RepID=UPI000D687F2F|nr:EamA family transporter [Ornithinimicrobium cavernae]
MGVLLALGSSAAYGFADYFGGLLSRRRSFLVIALLSQTAGLVLSLVVAVLLRWGLPQPADLAWGALSGVGTGLGMIFLYRGLSRGDMSVVVPVSAVGGVALPVLVGVGVLGDRPSALAWLGIAAAVPAIWLVSRSRGSTRSGTADGVTDALVASVWIALQYTALAQAGAEAGLWPIVAGRLAAAVCILPAVVTSGPHQPLGLRLSLGAVGTGALATLALLLYLLATREQLMTTAVVLSSLYPVLPVLLGITLLRERLSRAQVVGLVGAAAAIVLVSAG